MFQVAIKTIHIILATAHDGVRANFACSRRMQHRTDRCWLAFLILRNKTHELFARGSVNHLPLFIGEVTEVTVCLSQLHLVLVAFVLARTVQYTFDKVDNHRFTSTVLLRDLWLLRLRWLLRTHPRVRFDEVSRCPKMAIPDLRICFRSV